MEMADHGRQRDPQPVTRQGELALVVVAGIVYGLTWVAMVGLGLAAEVFGGGWFLPASEGTIAVMAGLLSGHPERGLTPDLAARVPGPVEVYSCVVGLELLAVTVGVAGAVLVARYRRPGDARRGMATRYEAAQVLGVRRLRAARAVIRPDLTTLSWLPSGLASIVGRITGRTDGRNS